MRNRILVAAFLGTLLVYVTSCYNNKEDILSLPKVSFRAEIVPIITSGACGCHNNGIGTRAVQFSHYDTVFYDAILSRTSLFTSWVNGGAHPGGGAIDFSTNEKALVKSWLAQGGKDDGGGCTVTGKITFTTNINPIYTTTCKGSTCHGGIVKNLDYSVMVADKTIITSIMDNAGAKGHPGGILSLSTCTLNTFKEWLNQGQPQ